MAGSIIELSNYRYERALEELKNAKEVFEAGSYKLALNRSYYAIFHAMRHALFILRKCTYNEMES